MEVPEGAEWEARWEVGGSSIGFCAEHDGVGSDDAHDYFLKWNNLRSTLSQISFYVKNKMHRLKLKIKLMVSNKTKLNF